MNLEERRKSSHVEDRRSQGRFAGKKAGLGLGGLVIVGIVYLLMGGNITDVLNRAGDLTAAGTAETYTPTPEENDLAEFASKVLAATEDIWTREFAAMGKKYEAPGMVLYHGATDAAACGYAQSACGPFYCSGDQKIYIDLAFFDEMKRHYGGGGDFAYAYVIAHEVGHHVQYLLGILDRVNAQRSQSGKEIANQLSVRLELQADCLAGYWAYHDNRQYNSLSEGDVEEAVNAAAAIGDDRLQKQSSGRVVPDSFTHGTSAQRGRWLKKGLNGCSFRETMTYSQPYSEL